MSTQSECRSLNEGNQNIQSTMIYCCMNVHTKKTDQASKNFSSHEYPLWFVTLFTKLSLERLLIHQKSGNDSI